MNGFNANAKIIIITKIKPIDNKTIDPTIQLLLTDVTLSKALLELALAITTINPINPPI